MKRIFIFIFAIAFMFIILRVAVQKESDIVNQDLETISGEVVYGHEVRSFRPEGSEEELWLMGNLEEVKARFTEEQIQNYEPIQMTLVGERAESPTDGFGSDYAGAFMIIKVLDVVIE